MTTVNYNADVADDFRRERLYQGQLFVYSPRPTTVALCDLARDMAVDAFAPHDPRHAQHHLPVEQYVEILSSLKPNFIHHPRAKELIRRILEEFRCDLDKTYFDVPRLRTATSDGYLTSGLGYAFKPHRDTWYSPPMCQLNWWLPVFEIEADNTMAFHPHYWERPVKNSSHEFNYQTWQQTGRKAAPKLVKQDTRKQSEALEPMELEPDLRLVVEPGAMIVFSAAQMHSTVPNTSGYTRFSIDFRTVHRDDLVSRQGAPNVDSACGGTTIRDYVCGRDVSQLPEDICALYENPSVPDDSTCEPVSNS